VGELRAVRIGHDNNGHDAAWHVHEVIVFRPGAPCIKLPANRWLATDEEDGQTWVTLTPGGADSGLPRSAAWQAQRSAELQQLLEQHHTLEEQTFVQQRSPRGCSLEQAPSPQHVFTARGKPSPSPWQTPPLRTQSGSRSLSESPPPSQAVPSRQPLSPFHALASKPLQDTEAAQSESPCRPSHPQPHGRAADEGPTSAEQAAPARLWPEVGFNAEGPTDLLRRVSGCCRARCVHHGGVVPHVGLPAPHLAFCHAAFIEDCTSVLATPNCQAPPSPRSRGLESSQRSTSPCRRDDAVSPASVQLQPLDASLSSYVPPAPSSYK
jgi:hypothetical protein